MRVGPVSGDLLVELALGALVIGGVIWAARSAASAAGQGAQKLWDTASNAAWSISPLNNDNVIYQTANAGVSALAGREETTGGWVYSATHTDPMAVMRRTDAANATPVTDRGDGSVDVGGQTYTFGYQ